MIGTGCLRDSLGESLKNVYEVSFWGNANVFKMTVVMIAKLFEYANKL